MVSTSQLCACMLEIMKDEGCMMGLLKRVLIMGLTKLLPNISQVESIGTQLSHPKLENWKSPPNRALTTLHFRETCPLSPMPLERATKTHHDVLVSVIGTKNKQHGISQLECVCTCTCTVGKNWLWRMKEMSHGSKEMRTTRIECIVQRQSPYIQPHGLHP